MSNTNSSEFTNFLATPRVLNAVGLQGGRVRVCQGNFEVADTDFDADGDEIRLCVVPSNARILSIKIGADDMDTGGSASAVNIGFSQVNAAGTLTIVDEDYFASVVEDFRIPSRLTEYVDESKTTTLIENWGERLWEIAALSADTADDMVITMTQTASVTTDAAATVYYVVLYVID